MPLRILVVEDHSPFRRLICTELQRQAEFQTIEAADGLEAVRKASELQPDLVLLDITLPKMHGFEVAQQIRTLAPSARILFLSQESSPDIVRKALSLGADGYIHKMSAAPDLPCAVAAALAGRRFVSKSVAFVDSADTAVPRRHELLFCSDDTALVSCLTRSVAAALSVADAALVLATEPHWTQILHELRSQGVDVDGAIQRGTCRSFDADVALDPVRVLRVIDDVRAASVRAGRAQARIVFCGERAGCLWAAGRKAEAIRLEQYGNELPHDVDILCVYPVPDTIGDPALTQICAEHTAVHAS